MVFYFTMECTPRVCTFEKAIKEVEVEVDAQEGGPNV